MEQSSDIAPMRRLAISVAGYYFFSLAGLAIASPYLPLYWKARGFNGAALGALLTAQGLGGLLAQGPVGYASDRGGRRRGLVVGAMLSGGVASLLYPGCASLWTMLMVTLWVSAAFRSSDALVQAMVADAAAGTRMAATYGRLRMMGSVGWVCSLLLSARVAAMTDTRALPGATRPAPMFLVIAASYFAAAGFILLARALPSKERLRLGPFAALKAVAHAPGMAHFLVAFVLYWTGLQGIGAFLSLHLKQLGAGHGLISTAFIVSATAETPIIFLAGRLADRWSERRLLNVAFAVLPVRLLLTAIVSAPWVILAIQTLHGITYGLMIVGSVTYVSHRLPPSLRASGQGALGVVMSVATTAAPFLGAFVAHWLGYRGAFVALAVVAFAGWLVLKGLPDDLESEPTDGGGKGEASAVAAAR